MTNTPVFGMTQILRGFTNFEDIYRGQPSSTPIMLSTQPSGRDPQALALYNQLVQQYKVTGFPVDAASVGISPRLVAGLPVPIGSLVQLWLPNLQQEPEDELNPGLGYHYVVMWRLRSQQADRDQGVPFHSTADGPSSPDPSDSGGGPEFTGAAMVRRLIPAGWDTILYPQAQTSLNSTYNLVRNNLYPMAIRPSTVPNLASQLFQPLLPPIQPGAGFDMAEYQQGVFYDPADSNEQKAPSWSLYEVQAKGDEMLLGLFRAATPEVNDTWDFTGLGLDYIVSQIFGKRARWNDSLQAFEPNPLLGAYALTGTGP